MGKVIKFKPKQPRNESRMLTSKEIWDLKADLKKKAAWAKKHYEEEAKPS